MPGVSVSACVGIGRVVIEKKSVMSKSSQL